MNTFLDKISWKILLSWTAWWSIMGISVCIDRIIEQWDMATIVSAWSKQALSTFLMAVSCLCVYDLISEKLDDKDNNVIKKIIIWSILAALSWLVNNVVQKNTLWSLEESIMISWIAAWWLLVHEIDLIERVRWELTKNKYQILEVINNISNITWLK